MNIVALTVWGGTSGVGLEGAESFSPVAFTRVVSMPRAFIMSLKVGSDSSFDDWRSGGGWALFLILVVSPFLGVSMRVFKLGAILN